MTDILIIGDGIIGRSLAFSCFKAGYETKVLSRVNPHSATHAAAGMLTPAAEIETAEEILIQFAQTSCEQYREFVTRIEEASKQECQFSRSGTLMLALHRDHHNDLRYLAEAQQAVGMQVQTLSRHEVLEKEPNLSPQVVGALYAEHDYHVNPRALHAALGQALVVNKIETINADAIVLQPHNNKLERVCYSQKEVQSTLNAKYIIVCAGAWSNDVLPPQVALSGKPIKGQYLRLHGPKLLNHVIRTPDVYLVPRPNGEIYLGASLEDQGFNMELKAGAMMELLYHGWRAVPGTYEMQVLEQGIGFRPSLRDNLPAIGKTAIEGLLVATGHYRHGIMLAPQTNQLILDILSATPSPYEKAFSPQRFKSQQPQAQSISEAR